MRNIKCKIQDSYISRATCYMLHTTGIAVIFLLPTYLIRFEVFGVPTNMINVLMAMFIAIALFWTRLSVFRIKAKKIAKENAIFLLGIFLLFLGLFVSAGQDGFSESELGIMKSWFMLPIAYVSTYFLLFQGKKERQALLWSYIGSAFFVSGIALTYFLLGNMTYDGRLKAFYESPNHLAMYIAPAMVMLWFFAQKVNRELRIENGEKRNSEWRIVNRGKENTEDCTSQSSDSQFTIHNSQFIQNIYLGLIIFTLLTMILALYLTQSYGALLAVFVSILVGEYIFLREKQAFKRVFAGGAIVFLMVILSQCTSEKWNDLAAFDERSSLASRVIIWRAAWDIGADNWFFGIGPGNFQEKYLAYQQYYPPYLEWAVPQPHNLYIAFWLQTGLIGFVGFLIIICTVAAATRPLCSHPTAVGNEKTAILLDIAVFCAFLAILIHGLIDTPYWKNDLSVVFWVLVLLSVTWRRADV